MQISMGSTSPMFEVMTCLASWPELAYWPQSMKSVVAPDLSFNWTRSIEPPSRPIMAVELNLILMSKLLPMPALRQHVATSACPQTVPTQCVEPAPGTWRDFESQVMVVHKASCSTLHFSVPCAGQSTPKAPMSGPQVQTFMWQAGAVPRPSTPHQNPGCCVQFCSNSFCCATARWRRRIITSSWAFRMSPVSQPLRRLVFSAAVS
mmetsp:Transcript_29671/g.67259  ORF Transcript_29671/g.67259 Transcript_29671/m.67259 type:complete len:206 (+) Transcript_29671:302-919(+)